MKNKDKVPLKNVFVKKIPLKLFIDLLEKICSHMEGRGMEKGERIYYYVSEYEYRKMVFENLHLSFLHSIRECYSPFFSRYYERDFTYDAFKTILRQICKIHGIHYEKDSIIVNSDTTVRYRIYLSHSVLLEYSVQETVDEKNIVEENSLAK
jgi:hypothetical protein